MKEKLWAKEYLFSLLLVFGVNMGYALLNSVMAIYGTVLTSSSVMGGYMITVFMISALFVRLFIKKLNEKFSNKVLLIFGLCLTVIASIGYCLANDIVTFLIFRMIHGFGFGISLTCATAISNEYVPSSRLSEGVGFTSSANTIANAIGPTIALEILGEKYTNFFTLFAVLLIISAVIFGLSLFVKSNTKAQKVNNEHQSYNGVIIACVFFLATFCQGAVNSF
ncbi:MAG TPA: MFS transporter [Candidatus Erysipelatoclostridium merdavium]|uniref:MFS transporter n=2 Tax=Erysipelotrichales TaxID=526525 RepID=A0A9D1XK79_9FIRM|nr:MFS transporter [Candidatus Erysipelatoclostridium merdavium]